MADAGPLEGVLGGGEAEESQDRQALAGADVLATSIAMDAARHDPELSRKAGEYLDKHSSTARRASSTSRPRTSSNSARCKPRI